MNRVFIGYDPSEAVAFHVLSHSIMQNASKPVAIIPINRENIPEFTRPRKEGATEFSFSRFLTPYLAGYEGKALFMDCDMLVMDDINILFDLCGESHPVYCVKHNYTPKHDTKFLGNKQHIYPKKNWSSLMMFNCDQCKDLTLDIVNEETGAYLHQFQWADSVGDIPKEWNHLVGEYDTCPDASIAHYTLGTPCFEGYENQEFSDEWRHFEQWIRYHD